jgi:hypothetical protein
VRLGRALCVVVVAAALTGQGCGGGGSSDQEAITAVVNELFAVQQTGDAAKACSDVYVIAEPDRPAGEAEGEGGEGEEGESGGEGSDACEAAFEAADERRQNEVSDLTTDISSINVDGDSATAIVHTELQRVDGSHLSQDVPYDLVKTPDGWRIRIAEEG